MSQNKLTSFVTANHPVEVSEPGSTSARNADPNQNQDVLLLELRDVARNLVDCLEFREVVLSRDADYKASGVGSAGLAKPRVFFAAKLDDHAIDRLSFGFFFFSEGD